MWLLGSAAVALLFCSFTPIRKNREEGRPGCLGAPGMCCGTATAGDAFVVFTLADLIACRVVVMEVDSEDDLFDEADEFDDDDAWGIIWDAGIDDEDFDGDMYDNGDVDDSSIDGSEDLSAGVMEEFLREKSAK